VNEATTRADASASALNEIVALASQTSEEIKAIAGAARHQAEAGREVNTSVENMRAISEQTGVAMGESANAVAELADQARSLGAIVEQIRDDADSTAETEDESFVAAA